MEQVFLITVTMQSKVYIWNRLIAGIAGSNPVGCMDIRLLCFLCVV
jgi:hypothetical protein